MQAGELRHRVTIQELVDGQDPSGQPIQTWQDVATVWAAVEPLRGREFWDAQQVAAEETVRIRIRYRAGIETAMRAVWNGVPYALQAVTDVDGRHRELELIGRRVV